MDTPIFEIQPITTTTVDLNPDNVPVTWSQVQNKPFTTIGTGLEVVNNVLNAIGTVEDVKVNGTSVVDEDGIAQVTVPTKTSDITNDSGFITAAYHDATKQDVINDLSTIRSGAALGATSVQPGDNVSTLTNDAGYLTQHQSLAAYRTAAAQDVIDATKIGDAASDNKQYARKNGAWSEVAKEVPYLTVVNGELCIVYEVD